VFVNSNLKEGCFGIEPKNHWTRVQLTFQIGLHIDDAEVLYKIAENLGIGKVYIYKNNDMARFLVNKFDDIYQILIPILQEFSLQTTKYLDFTGFLEAANLINERRVDGRLLRNNLLEIVPSLVKLKESMNKSRLEINKKEEELLKNKVTINMWWLLGFVEGEGTFGYTASIPYFQIAQNKKNLFVLDAIRIYLLNIFKQSTSTEVEDNLGLTCNIDNRTDVYKLVVTKIDTNFKYILPFFLSMSFSTRKKIDFYYW